MRQTFGILVVAALSLSSIQSNAAVKDLPFVVLSEGNSTCGEFIAEPAKQQLRLSWMLGYITGRNIEADDRERTIGSSFDQPATAVGWLQTYCAKHAFTKLIKAADDLRLEFRSIEQPVPYRQ